LTEDIRPQNAGVKVESNGKIIVDHEDRTIVENIYAIGDVQ